MDECSDKVVVMSSFPLFGHFCFHFTSIELSKVCSFSRESHSIDFYNCEWEDPSFRKVLYRKC